MKLAIIGAGNIGGTLGKKWAAAGHEICYGSREPASPIMQSLLAETAGQSSAAGVKEALQAGQAVLLAVPSGTVPDLVRNHAKALEGKIVIDATNNFSGSVISQVATIHAGAPLARVYRAFNSLGWEVFADPQIEGSQVDHFYCGPDGEDRLLVETLIREIGLRPLWVGGLDRLALVDGLGALWVTMAFRQGLGRRWALKALVAE